MAPSVMGQVCVCVRVRVLDVGVEVSQMYVFVGLM